MSTKEFFYSEKFYNSFAGKAWFKVMHNFSALYDLIWDMRICGTSLAKYVETEHREDMGATGSQSTRYWTLDEVFGEMPSDTDSFIDVGCGKGRVLAYMIKRGFKGKITGVELNETVAEYAGSWSKKYDNITVIAGDAFALDYNDYTVLFMCRPFEPEFFAKFLEKLESELTHRIRLYYWVDQQSGYMLKDRPGWTMKKRRIIYAKYFAPLARTPQGYSVWDYNPENR